MDVTEALLESWRRQADIMGRIAAHITPSQANLKPSEDGWSIAHHLCHVSEVRYYWLKQVDPARAEKMTDLYPDGKPTDDLDLIRQGLSSGAELVLEACVDLFAKGVQAIGGYDHPVLFLQHMVWHEGWHYGLIALALRLGGQEPDEPWQEENVWGLWRFEEWQ